MGSSKKVVEPIIHYTKKCLILKSVYKIVFVRENMSFVRVGFGKFSILFGKIAVFFGGASGKQGFCLGALRVVFGKGWGSVRVVFEKGLGSGRDSYVKRSGGLWVLPEQDTMPSRPHPDPFWEASRSQVQQFPNNNPNF